MSVAAGAGEVVDFWSLTYMQDMTTDICKNAPVNASKQLIDKRTGNKQYWVAKLADGNCWMTQNLALDLSTTTALTPSDSDVSANWTSTNNTQTTPNGWGNNNAVVRSYNPGEYVYTTPATQNQCANNSTGLSACTGNGWYNVAGKNASNAVNFYQANGNSVVSTDEYDAHYLAGNYYSWPAATVQSGASISSGNATQSICPKGWQLPVNSGNKSYDTLLTAYGSYQSNTLLYGTQDIRLTPLYFVYGGLVYNSSLFHAGSDGRYWSSVASTASGAYNLSFDTSVGPSSSFNRYYGFSVRCVAR